MSLPELEKLAKGLQMSLFVMGGSILLMALAGGYLTYLRGFNVFTFLPLMFVAIAFGNISQLKKVKQEIASRSNS